jgi:hypothetical protein
MAVLLALGFPFAAGGAVELHIQRFTTHYQAVSQPSTAVRERVPIRDACTVVVLWSICILTLVEADMLSAADPEPLT